MLSGLKGIQHLDEAHYEAKTQCPCCKSVSTFPIDKGEYYRYIHDGDKIQDAFESLDKTHREKLLTGICQDCWDKIAEEI